MIEDGPMGSGRKGGLARLCRGDLRQEVGRLAQGQHERVGLGFAAGQVGLGGGEVAVAEAGAGDFDVVAGGGPDLGTEPFS